MPQRMAHPDEIRDLPAQQGGYLGRLLDAFSVQGRARLREIAWTRAVPPRTVLVAEREDPPEVGFVLSGTLAMTKLHSDGRGHILGLLVPTEMYGRLFGGPSSYHIEALSNARLLCFRRPIFEALLAKEPAAERLYLIHVLDELDLARESVLLLNGSKVISRVASFLVMLARRSADPVHDPPGALSVQVPLRRTDLASYLGARPETLSRALHDLEDRNVLRLLDPYRFEITDFPTLIEVSGQDFAPPGRAAPRS